MVGCLATSYGFALFGNPAILEPVDGRRPDVRTRGFAPLAYAKFAFDLVLFDTLLEKIPLRQECTATLLT